MNFDQSMLLCSVFIPMIASLTLLLGICKRDDLAVKIAYVGFGLPCIIGIYLFFRFDPSIEGYNFAILFAETGLHEINVSFHLGLNGVSSPLFMMAGIVGFGAGLAAIYSGCDRLKLYLALLLFMQSGLMGLFASVDLLFYYLFHEFALIPTFIMIGIWGGRNRRSIALEITIYLTLGALISLGGLVALNVLLEAPKFDFPSLSAALANQDLFDSTQAKIFGLLLFGLGILVALFPFHTWAARGYEAAPTSVSMLHAGVLKKFGLYGLIQIAVPLLPEGASAWSPYILWLAIGNVLFVGLVAIAQNNLKSMIGNGSVMHMGYCFLGIGACSTLGASSAVLLMVAHGLSVALMFLLSHYINLRTRTLEMNEIGGLASKSPILACFFVAASLATIGLPGFGNFWGEFGIFLSLGEVAETRLFLGLAALGIIISAIFGLRAVANIFFGEPSDDMKKTWKDHPVKDLSLREIFPAVLILVPLLLLGLWPRETSIRVDREINSRYQAFNRMVQSSKLPPCCPPQSGDPSIIPSPDSNASLNSNH